MSRVLKPVPDTFVWPVNVIPDQTTPDPAEEAERQAHAIQALSEGVDTTETVELLGEHYRIADRMSAMTLMKFAVSAKAGAKSEDIDGLVDTYNVLNDCIHPDDWERFEADSIAKKADFDELMEVFAKAMAMAAARPTRPRSGSSPGRSSTGESLTDVSSPARRVPEGFEDLTPVAALG